jgi:hypothetical protein
MIELSQQQRQELREHSSMEMRVRDPETHQEYVLVRAEVYDRIKSLVHADEETLISSAYPLLDEMAAKSGWDDPALDVYNDLIPRDRQ